MEFAVERLLTSVVLVSHLALQVSVPASPSTGLRGVVPAAAQLQQALARSRTTCCRRRRRQNLLLKRAAAVLQCGFQAG